MAKPGDTVRVLAPATAIAQLELRPPAQIVAVTRAVPELNPNKPHMALPVPRDVRPGQRSAPCHPPRIRLALALATSSRHHTGPRPSSARVVTRRGLGG